MNSPWWALEGCCLYISGWVVGRTSVPERPPTARSGCRRSLAKRPRWWGNASSWTFSYTCLKQHITHKCISCKSVCDSPCSLLRSYLQTRGVRQWVEASGWTGTACTPASAPPAWRAVCLQGMLARPCCLPEPCCASRDSSGYWRGTRDLKEECGNLRQVFTKIHLLV